MIRVLEPIANIFDIFHAFWENLRYERIFSIFLVLTFLLSMLVIEANRLGFLPHGLSHVVPTNVFYAVNIAFTLLLLQEVVLMILVLPQSFSKSVGKQFEILSLILLRSCFKELVNIHEPLLFPQDITPLLRILSDGAGAVAVFMLLAIFVRVGRVQMRSKGERLYSFVVTKKTISVLLLAIFAGMGIYNLTLGAMGQGMFSFFPMFYTVLIFCDILLVLVSQVYMPCYVAVFRNSSLALCTVFIRLALSAPPFYNAAIGVGSALFAVLIVIAHNILLSGRPTARD
ncbi:hypothetical protein [Desulfobaculum bizertense]|uniref:Uncharacterized protein n=1 Tax=Desulfobaculum bizertense DSM 18034 TaxID=1121442 RepID=A0A1T4VWG2_9BACT|nr:hypothetical protein [Desulfobaculum bizertense]UIJ36788.1 hypothetical protein LWC08_08545 [Desulfobaculum bizertense]SKA69277.1 hypothetical protein SAMN02745702_01088 [Desulfobaculum bizertense DSM 18034]